MAVEDDIVIRAKIRLQKGSPFFSYLVQTLDISVDESTPMKTASVSVDKVVKLHPEFVMSIGEDCTVGVLCHEVMHVALDHFRRTGDRDKILANIAQDIVVNDILVSNAIRLPENGLIPTLSHKIMVRGVEIIDIDTKTWEEVYEELVSGEDDGVGGFDTLVEPAEDPGEGCRDGDPGQAANEGKATKEAQKMLSDAMAYAQLQGNVPNGVTYRLDALLESKVDWRELLSAHISRQIPYDYSMARPSKKSMAVGVYLPSVVKESLEVVVVLDTSGSISEEHMKRFASEVVGIATSFNGVKVSLIQADCEVQSTLEISGDYEDVIRSLEVKGGGGTSHIPVFEHIAKENPDARIVVCFTDGYTDYPAKEPEVETIWAMTNSNIAPFGRTVLVDYRNEVNE